MWDLDTIINNNMLGANFRLVIELIEKEKPEKVTLNYIATLLAKNDIEYNHSFVKAVYNYFNK